MLTKGFVLIVVGLGVLLSVGASWGVATLASSRTVSAPSSAATGVPEIAGTYGKNGNDGKAGTNGAPGARGAVGARGPAGTDGAPGAQGAVGAQGLAGTDGAPGASAPTFSALSASGVAFTRPGTYTFPDQTTQVPAGKALVGFSVSLDGRSQNSLYGTQCLLVNDRTDRVYGRVYIPSSANNQNYTFAATEFVNLLSPAILAIKCSIPYLEPGDQINYSSLSVFAISFAQ